MELWKFQTSLRLGVYFRKNHPHKLYGGGLIFLYLCLRIWQGILKLRLAKPLQ